MKVLLRKRVRKLGTIGDIVEVKSGYARNYLIPQGLGIVPSDSNIRQVEREKEKYLEQLALEKKDLQARANLLSGKEVTISARANNVGHLYGSIGPAQIAHAMDEMQLPVTAEEIILPEPIRTLDKYDIKIELDDDITTEIHLWVVPLDDPDLENAIGEEQAEIESPEENIDAGETISQEDTPPETDETPDSEDVTS